MTSLFEQGLASVYDVDTTNGASAINVSSGYLQVCNNYSDHDVVQYAIGRNCQIEMWRFLLKSGVDPHQPTRTKR